MHEFDFINRPKELLTPEVVALLTCLHECRGRAKDNIWIERFCKTIKYKYIYIQPEENGADLFFGIKRFIDNYNYHRRHQGINRTVPSKLYIRQTAWS